MKNNANIKTSYIKCFGIKVIMTANVIYCKIDFLKVLFEHLNRKYFLLDDDDWKECEYVRRIIKILSNKLICVHFDNKQQFSQLQKDNRDFIKTVKRVKDYKAYVTLNIQIKN